ncbi:MAG: nucleotidyltransferase [Nitrospira sp.]|nr:nucleotidyltransferase [Nitrospira sp.]MDH4245372.1 nucleotidyltransferase [Nitrospira sp.]MDH4357791.1 nucleotidyltransferase [Nitrospira sp.]MDH5320046.1 nucleotidyltransferase [Nitrospira sp.]
MAEESLLAQTLSSLITDFNRRGIQYALAGGWAYSALVEPRATTDIDVLLLLEQPSRDRLQSLLSSLFDSIIVHPAAMVFHGISIWRCVGVVKNQEVVIDLLLADSDYLRTALARRRQILLGDVSVSILSLEDLILLKTLAGRLQDQADLEKISLRQDELHIDWTYVTEWKVKLGLA